ncbi:hypothetical protein HAX54_012532 [Datura stramonium]|uniref:U-box domain-containing protein n=1 Tax=Datura stramonium TaxID=4076 RepID=A0ABS8RXI0_DATST|nr:hypothetical protein [Datura stramonium]
MTGKKRRGRPRKIPLATLESSVSSKIQGSQVELELKELSTHKNMQTHENKEFQSSPRSMISGQNWSPESLNVRSGLPSSSVKENSIGSMMTQTPQTKQVKPTAIKEDILKSNEQVTSLSDHEIQSNEIIEVGDLNPKAVDMEEMQEKILSYAQILSPTRGEQRRSQMKITDISNPSPSKKASEIMKDPVTAITGITYDHDSIECWLSKNPSNDNNAICPVTKLPVPRDSDLTPNHTLRRLIQAWCVANGFNGVDWILTPKPPLSKFYVVNLVHDLSVPRTENIKTTLEKLETLAKENERNKTYMVEVGVHKALVNFLIQHCYKKCDTTGLEKSLSTLSLIWDSSLSCHENNIENRKEELMDSLTWALGLDRCMQNHAVIKNHAMNLLRSIIGKANNSGTLLDRLKPQLFEKIIGFLRESDSTIAQKGVNAALHVMLDTSSSGRNRNMMIESRAIFELIELEINKSSSNNKKTKELIFGILFNLCSCADGRAQLLSHAAGIAMITKRILKVSPIVDEKGMLILGLISKYSPTSGVLQEMLKVKSVSKICTVIQADCPSYLKDKAREILRSHFDVWKNSPCVEVATLTRYA